MPDSLTERLYYSGSLAWILLLPVSLVFHLWFLVMLPPWDSGGLVRATEALPEDQTYQAELRFIPEEPKDLPAPREGEMPPPPKDLSGDAWMLPHSFNVLDPPPLIDLPEVTLPESSPEIEVPALPQPIEETLPKVDFGRSLLPRGDLTQANPPDLFESMASGETRAGALAPHPEKMDTELPPVVVDLASLPQGLSLTGPVSERATYPPPLPSLAKGKDVTIRLKFWVRPDGWVGRTAVLQKGDPELERLSADFLRRWRFAPLPPGKEQVNQWGEITIRVVTGN